MSMIRTFGQGEAVPRRVFIAEGYAYNIIQYGRGNSYPQEIEYAIARSGIATACMKVFSEFLYGGGFAEGGGIPVNQRGETLNDILLAICTDFAVHRGFSARLNYNLLGEYTSIEKEPFAHIRLVRPDGMSYNICSAKISDDWAGESWKLADSPAWAIEVPLFMPSSLRGLTVDDLIGNTKGQLLYATLESGFYTASFFDSVIERVLVSGDIAEYDRKFVGNGFSASQVFINKAESISEPAYLANVAEVKKFGGYRGAGGVFYMEGDIEALDLTKGQKMSDQYMALNNAVKDDILEALGIPPVLTGRTRQGGFPNQDEIINAFEYYNGMIDQYRQFIARQFDMVAQHFAYPILPSSGRFEILPKTFKKSNATV